MSNYGLKTVVFFEIDQPLCSLTYSEPPCAAKLMVTGIRKCFNTFATCQDTVNFTPGVLTLRFAFDDDGLALEYGPLFACLEDVKIKPGRINVAGMEDSSAAFGTRETATITLRDFKWSDHQVDKYRLERTFVSGQQTAGYAIPAQTFPTFGCRARAMPESPVALADFFGYDDPALAGYNRGTFWSRWLARNPYYPAMNCRVRWGYVGQTIEEMRVAEYVLEKVTPPNNNGIVTITATDLFTKIQARKAVAPFRSIGNLDADITGTPATFALSTPAVGSLTPKEGGYSTITGVVEGYLNIGNKEIIKVTRSGGTFTVVQRAALGTTQADHKAGDSVQLVLSFVAQKSHDATYTLITGYSEIASSRINKPEWDTLAADVDELFTAYIAEPTPVEDLVGELMVQGGFTVWPEVSTGMIRYAPLRSGAVSPSVTDRDWIVDGSLTTNPRDDKRISQVLVYYVKRSPLTDLEEPTSYAARILTPGPGASPYGTESLRKIFSRWITTGGQSTAAKCGERVFSMYQDPPIEAHFQQDALRAGQLEEMKYFSLEVAEIQDDVGDVKPIAMTPVSIRRGVETEDIDAMSVRFSETTEDGVRRIFVDTDELNLVLRDLHDSQYGSLNGDEIVEFVFSAIGGSSSTGAPAVRTGSWPGGVQVRVSFMIGGRFQGRSGDSGSGGSNATGGPGANGAPGGGAFLVEVAITVDLTNLEIFGGAGGSGGGGAAIFGSIVPAGKGGGGAGSGAGTNVGSPGAGGNYDASGFGGDTGTSGTSGTADSSGVGGVGASGNTGYGGNGAGPGLDGLNGGAGVGSIGGFPGGSGAVAGYAISGVSLVTFVGTGGDIRGPQI